MKVKVPFMDEIPGLVIIKIIDGGTYIALLIKLKFTCNKAILDIKNKGKGTMILRPEEIIGIIDMRPLGYYKSQKSPTDKYPWLDPDDERKHMTDREILEKSLI